LLILRILINKTSPNHRSYFFYYVKYVFEQTPYLIHFIYQFQIKVISFLETRNTK